MNGHGHGQCPNCKDFFGSDLPDHLEHSSCAVKKAAPAPAKKKMIDPHSSFRPYWTIMKIRMNYDEVGETISSHYNFIERNGFGFKLAHIFNRRKYHNESNPYDYMERLRKEREQRKKEQKYATPITPITPKWPHYTPVFSKVSKATKQSIFNEYKEPKKVSERERNIIEYENRYLLSCENKTFAFREFMIMRDWRSRTGQDASIQYIFAKTTLPTLPTLPIAKKPKARVSEKNHWQTLKFETSKKMFDMIRTVKKEIYIPPYHEFASQLFKNNGKNSYLRKVGAYIDKYGYDRVMCSSNELKEFNFIEITCLETGQKITCKWAGIEFGMPNLEWCENWNGEKLFIIKWTELKENQSQSGCAIEQ